MLGCLTHKLCLEGWKGERQSRRTLWLTNGSRLQLLNVWQGFEAESRCIDTEIIKYINSSTSNKNKKNHSNFQSGSSFVYYVWIPYSINIKLLQRFISDMGQPKGAPLKQGEMEKWTKTVIFVGLFLLDPYPSIWKNTKPNENPSRVLAMRLLRAHP